MNELGKLPEMIQQTVAAAYAAGLAAGKVSRGRAWRDKWLRWLGGGGVLVCLVLMALVVL